MPFPASPSNNDVHKLGNRTFVWDSTLGTWDQVKETERTNNNTILVNSNRAGDGYADSVERTSLAAGRWGGAVTQTVGSGSMSSTSLFGAANVNIWSSSSTQANDITWDYGAGNKKLIKYIEWYQHDGGGNNTGIHLRGSNDNSTWDDLGTITSKLVNSSYYKYINPGIVAYRYWQLYYTWSSNNYGSLAQLRIFEAEEPSTTPLSPATVFPSGHVLQTRSIKGFWQSSSTSTSFQQQADALLTITPLFESSGILLNCNFAAYNSGDYGVFDFYKAASNVPAISGLSGKTFGLIQLSGTSKWYPLNMQYFDKCPESGRPTEKTYKILYKSQASGTTYCGWGSHSPMVFTAQEIASPDSGFINHRYLDTTP